MKPLSQEPGAARDRPWRAVRSGLRRLIALIAIVFIAHSPATALAQGIQHLVRPGDHWSDLADRLQPGDQIILMPGRHRPGQFDDLRGTEDRPITIRGLNDRHPSTIEAGRQGIRLRRCDHIVIRDLTITGASISVIEFIDDTPDHAGQPPQLGNITIRRVNVLDTGPSGRRHGIRLQGLRNISIEQTRIEGWGGSAIAVIGCRNVTVTDCTMIGREGFGQLYGVQARAGTQSIRIERNTIRDAGIAAIALGNSALSEEFQPALPEPDAEPENGKSSGLPETHHEVSGVSVRHNLIQGGECAIAFINTSRAIVRNNTILNPTEWVYVISDDPEDPRLEPNAHNQFGSNLITWPAGSLRELTAAGSGATVRGLTVEENLWWAEPNGQESQRDPLLEKKPVGSLQFEQRTDLDPDLDDRHRPRTPEAQVFGRHAP